MSRSPRIALSNGTTIPQLGFPKSMRRERMEENLDVCDFELSAQEVASICTLDRGERGRIGPNPMCSPGVNGRPSRATQGHPYEASAVR